MTPGTTIGGTRLAGMGGGCMVAVFVATLFITAHTAGRPQHPSPPHPPPADGGQPAEATVRLISIIDGNTIIIAPNETVRYAGIDVPEHSEPLGREATRRNKALLGPRTLRIIPLEGKDGTERTLAVVLAADGEGRPTDVAEALLKEGLGWIDTRNLTDDQLARYWQSQVAAMEANRGIWARVREAAGSVRAGRSGVFHIPDCLLGSQRTETYDSALEAFKEGLRPHKRSSTDPGCWTLR